jgi:hypothetical protein
MKIVLTAVRRDNVFYISHAPEFPTMWGDDEVPTRLYFAKLVVGTKEGHFSMLLNVDYCMKNFLDDEHYDDDDDDDDEGDNFSCVEPLLYNVNGLQMFDGTQSMETMTKVHADMRCLTVRLPCFGRTFNEGTLGGEDNRDPPAVIQCNNRLPEWNASLKSLVLKFHNSRVTVASPKNFILSKTCTEKSTDPNDAIMQFGKKRKGVYAMDVKQPAALLQAFGLSLTTFQWKK